MPVIGRDSDAPRAYPIRVGQIVIGHVSVIEGMTKEDFDFFWKKLLANRAAIESYLIPRPPTGGRD